MKIEFVLAALLTAFIGFTPPVMAASFAREASDKLNFITITGRIVEGDAATFKAIAGTLHGDTAVLLSSEGGALYEGLLIGSMIHNLGYSTAVPPNSECASVCGFMWLAGSHRFYGTGSKVGFHAAYIRDAQGAHPTGSGNALAGAYLAHLGLTYEAIVYLTSAAPNELRWLTKADAQRLGIDCTFVSSASMPPLSVPPLQRPRVRTDGSFRRPTGCTRISASGHTWAIR